MIGRLASLKTGLLMALIVTTVLACRESGFSLYVHNEAKDGIIVALAWEEGNPELYRAPPESTRLVPPLVGPFIGRIIVFDESCVRLAEFPTPRAEGGFRLVVQSRTQVTFGPTTESTYPGLISNPRGPGCLALEPSAGSPSVLPDLNSTALP